MRSIVEAKTGLEMYTRTWLTDKDILEARARFGEDAIVQDDEMD